MDDGHNGRGVATVLLEYLAAGAREVGIDGFTAQVLPSNRKMLGVLRQAGFAVRSRFADGAIEVDMAIDPTDTALAAMEERATTADARSVRRLLEPASLAVVGAGRRPGTVGHEILRALARYGFAGSLHAVNPHAASIAGVPAHPRVVDIDGPVDVAVVTVPPDALAAVVEDCAEKGVAGLVVVTSEADREIVVAARRHGMRVIGPNSMGFVNTAPAVRARALFSPVPARSGGVALASQSGTIAAAIMNELHGAGLGISSFVSLGKGVDVTGTDLLSYWEGDSATSAVLLYLEAFGNPRTFSRVARRVSATKPIVAVRTATTPAFDVLLGQTGVVRVDTLEEMVGAGRVLASQPLPNGPRVAFMSNAGSPILAVQACEGAGLSIAALSSGGVNPVELTHRAGPDEYAAALSAVLADDGVDAVLVLYAPPVSPRTSEVADAVGRVAAGSAKPVVASFLADASVAGLGSIPNFLFPDAAARALGRAAAYAAWRAEPEGVVRVCDVAVDAARDLVADAIAEGPESGRLGAAAVLALLGCAGVTLVPQQLVTTEDEAVAAADTIGYPVALKATGVARLAKTEAGGVAVDVHDADEVIGSYRRMVEMLGDAMVPAAVQAMVEPGVDVRVAVQLEPTVGAVISLGPGGAAAPLELNPRAVRILPLTDLSAARLVDTAGVGDEGRAALEELLVRVSCLVDEIPEIVELELNPVIVSGTNAWVTDARVRVAPYPVDPLATVRHL